LVSELVAVYVIGLPSAALGLAVPLIFGGIGETFGQRSGVMNLGLNGMMMFGALFGFAGANLTDNLWIGVLCGILGGVGLAVLFAFLCITLELNQTIVGVLLSLFATGVIGFAEEVVFGADYIQSKVAFHPYPIPFLASIPILGPMLFDHYVFVYIALVAAPVAYYVIYHTSWGLTIKAVGANPRAAHSLGIHVNRTRWYTTLFNGFMAGLAGAYVVLAFVPVFTNTSIVAEGWIAVALVTFGSWNPLTVTLGALVFSGTEAGILAVQTQGILVPTDILSMVPYILVLGMYVFVGRKKRDVPTELTVPFRVE
jgi:general nucleoside transport system permease protein